MRGRCRATIPTVLAALCAATAWPAFAQAVDPLSKAEELLLGGRNAEAQAAAREAQRIYQAKGDRHGEALSVLLLASAELEQEDFVAAAADLERSVTLLEAAGDRYTAWIALHQLGALELLRHRPRVALVRFEQALALAQTIDGSKAPFFQGLERLPGFLGRSPAVRVLLAARPEAARSLLVQVAEGTSRVGLAWSLLAVDRVAQAEAELARLADLSRAVGGAFDDVMRFLSGELRRRQGRLDEARTIFLEILDRPTSGPLDPTGDAFEALTQIEAAGGRFDEALIWNDKALALARRTGEPGAEAAVLGLRASVLEQAGRAGAAATALDEAREAATRGGSELQRALLLQQLGSRDSERGRPEKALPHFEAAARAFREAGHLELEAAAWAQLAQAYQQLGSAAAANAALDNARVAAQRSGARLLEQFVELVAGADLDVKEFGTRVRSLMELLEQGGVMSEDEVETLSRQWASVERIAAESPPIPPGEGSGGPVVGDAGGDVGLVVSVFELVAQNRFAEARDLLLTALPQARSDKEMEVFVLSSIGFSYAGEQNLQEALRFLMQAADALEQAVDEIRLEEFLAGYLSGPRQGLYALLIDLLSAFGRHEEAFDYAEKGRARAFLRSLGAPRVRLPVQADPSLALEAEAARRRVLEIERRRVADPGGDTMFLAAELQTARQRYEAASTRLKATSPEAAASHPRPTPLRLRAVQAELPADATLISYFVAATHVRAWVLDRETFHSVGLFSLSPGQVDLGRLVCWAHELARRSGGRGARLLDRPCGDAATSEEVYEKVFAPLRPHLRHRRLIVLLHDELHYLPFSALRDPQTGRYLVEDYTLTYAPSASALGQLRGKETPVAGKALVLGAPEELDPRLPALPAAPGEAMEVAGLLGTRPLLGVAATESRFHAAAGEADLLHVAAHGLYEPRNPTFSRIALTPDAEHDGNLEVHEIAGLDLAGVNLVVLSACDTARGERSRGDEVTSLSRAFLSAGSPGVVSTLWSVEDDAAALLMKAFYRRLLDGASAAEALQQAQVGLLRSGRFTRPQYWGAFTLTGDPLGRWRSAAERK